MPNSQASIYIAALGGLLVRVAAVEVAVAVVFAVVVVAGEGAEDEGARVRRLPEAAVEDVGQRLARQVGDLLGRVEDVVEAPLAPPALLRLKQAAQATQRLLAAAAAAAAAAQCGQGGVCVCVCVWCRKGQGQWCV